MDTQSVRDFLFTCPALADDDRRDPADIEPGIVRVGFGHKTPEDLSEDILGKRTRRQQFIVMVMFRDANSTQHIEAKEQMQMLYQWVQEQIGQESYPDLSPDGRVQIMEVENPQWIDAVAGAFKGFYQVQINLTYEEM